MLLAYSLLIALTAFALGSLVSSKSSNFIFLATFIYTRFFKVMPTLANWLRMDSSNAYILDRLLLGIFVYYLLFFIVVKSKWFKTTKLYEKLRPELPINEGKNSSFSEVDSGIKQRAIYVGDVRYDECPVFELDNDTNQFIMIGDSEMRYDSEVVYSDDDFQVFSVKDDTVRLVDKVRICTCK